MHTDDVHTPATQVAQYTLPCPTHPSPSPTPTCVLLLHRPLTPSPVTVTTYSINRDPLPAKEPVVFPHMIWVDSVSGINKKCVCVCVCVCAHACLCLCVVSAPACVMLYETMSLPPLQHEAVVVLDKTFQTTGPSSVTSNQTKRSHRHYLGLQYKQMTQKGLCECSV